MERPARADKCVRTVQYTNSAPGSKLLDPDVPPSGRPRWHLATVTFSTERSKCVSYMHQATSRLTVPLVLPHRSFEQTFDMQVLGEKKKKKKKKRAVGRRHHHDNTSSSRRNGSRRSPGSDETARGVLRMTAFRKACMKHSTHRP